MPVIKHFYGNYNANNGNNTIYTVPSGKVARVEGAFFIGPNTTESTTRTGTFLFGNLLFAIGCVYGAGGVINITQDGSDFTYIPSSNSNGSANVTISAFQGATKLYFNEFDNNFAGMTENEREKNYDMALRFPPIYLGPSQVINSYYNGNNRVTWQFVAIEEDEAT